MAVRLSHLWEGVPVVCLDRKLAPTIDASNAGCVYLVDDILATGKSVNWALAHLANNCGSDISKVIIVTWHYWPEHASFEWRSIPVVSANLAKKGHWIVYPWET